MKATIQNVCQEIRTWNSQYGEKKVVEGFFEDGAKWSIICSPDKADKQKAEMQALVGKEGEFEGKDRGNSRGYQEWGLTNWPGKEQRPFAAARAGGGYQVRYRDTEQGTKEERLSIARSVALQQAVLLHKGTTKEGGLEILSTADGFYEWLAKSQPLTANPAEPKPVEQRQEQVRQEIKSGQSSPAPATPKPSTYNRPICPNCDNGNAAVYQAKENGEYVPGSFYCWKQKGGCGHKWKDLGELAAQLGVKRGDEIETILEKATKEIAKAIADKDLERLRLIEERLVQRVDEGKLSLDEADLLDAKIISGRRTLIALQSGDSHAKWHDQAVQGSQNKLQEEQQKETANPLDEEPCPF